MQEAISLDTHLSWTVYLQTGRREEIGEHHSLARALPPPCSSCSTHRAEHQQRQVPPPWGTRMGWELLAWGHGGPGLTGAAEALLADPEQHGAAEVAVGRFLEVLQPPGVLPIVLHVLHGTRVEGEGGHSPAGGPCPLSPPLLSAFQPIKAPSVSVGVHSQQDHGLPLLRFSLLFPRPFLPPRPPAPRACQAPGTPDMEFQLPTAPRHSPAMGMLCWWLMGK